MTIRSSVGGAFACVCFAVSVVLVFSQEPTKPAIVAAFTPDEILTFNAIQTVGQLANAECQGLETAKRYQTMRQQFTLSYEKAHAGSTIDWGAGKPMAKVAPAPVPAK